MERLKDLVTILYRPRETMRRILDRPDRWAVAVVFLAFVCASVDDIDVRRAGTILSDITIPSMIALVTIGIVAGALAWVIALYILSWIATPVGRMMGGTGTFADVRAALAWAMVPIIWSVLYRLPIVILAERMHIGQEINARQVLMDFIARGGCSVIVIYFGLQLVFALWCVALASFTVAEAQHLSPQKGFVNVAVTIALPLMVMFAAIFTLRKIT